MKNRTEYFSSLGAKVEMLGSDNIEMQFYHANLSDENFDALLEVDNLESLVFYYCNVNDNSFLKLRKIKNLKKLGLYSCKGVTDASINIILEMPIRELAVFDTGISNEGKNMLVKLRPDLKLHCTK